MNRGWHEFTRKTTKCFQRRGCIGLYQVQRVMETRNASADYPPMSFKPFQKSINGWTISFSRLYMSMNLFKEILCIATVWTSYKHYGVRFADTCVGYSECWALSLTKPHCSLLYLRELRDWKAYVYISLPWPWVKVSLCLRSGWSVSKWTMWPEAIVFLSPSLDQYLCWSCHFKLEPKLSYFFLVPPLLLILSWRFLIVCRMFPPTIIVNFNVVE